MPFQFLNLPPEIRNRIYEFYFESRVASRRDESNDWKVIPCRRTFVDLLRVNRQISKEGSNVLYNQDPFVVVNLDPSIPFLPSIIAGQFSESQHDVADELVYWDWLGMHWPETALFSRDAMTVYLDSAVSSQADPGCDRIVIRSSKLPLLVYDITLGLSEWDPIYETLELECNGNSEMSRRHDSIMPTLDIIAPWIRAIQATRLYQIHEASYQPAKAIISHASTIIPYACEIWDHMTSHFNAYLLHNDHEWSVIRTEGHWSVLREVHSFCFKRVGCNPFWLGFIETGPPAVVARVKRIFLNTLMCTDIFALCSAAYDRQTNSISESISDIEAGIYEFGMAGSVKPAPEWHTQEDMYKALVLLVLVHQTAGEYTQADNAYEKALRISMKDAASRACLYDVLVWAVRVECFILQMRIQFYELDEPWYLNYDEEPHFKAYFRQCKNGGRNRAWRLEKRMRAELPEWGLWW